MGTISKHYVGCRRVKYSMSPLLILRMFQNVICVTGNARKEQVEEYRHAGFEDVRVVA